MTTASIRVAARKRLKEARGAMTRANRAEAILSGRGPEAMAAAARKVALAKAELDAAEAHYQQIAAQFMAPEVREAAVALRDEMRKAGGV